MSKDRHQASPIVFRCPAETWEAIGKIAIEQKKPKSEILRQLVDAGLVASGYKRDEEYLKKEIQEVVSSVIKPHVDRLAAISAKAAQISGATFFMDVYMGQLMLPDSEKQLVRDVAADARKLGIEYLKLKDRDVDAFISDGVEKVLDD